MRERMSGKVDLSPRAGRGGGWMDLELKSSGRSTTEKVCSVERGRGGSSRSISFLFFPFLIFSPNVGLRYRKRKRVWGRYVNKG